MNHAFGICNLPLVPLRKEPSDKSEMSSQLLFGDHFQVLERTDKWSLIQTAYDDYEGWVDNKQFVSIEQSLYVAMHDLNFLLGLNMPVFQFKITGTTDEVLNLLAGSNLPPIKKNSFDLGENNYFFDGLLRKAEVLNFNNRVVEAAKYYLHSPYLWGGRSLFGIDCSGFSQIVMKQFGIRLKRDAWQQAEQGDLVAFLQEVEAGDLAFFDDAEGRITHVGIMLNANLIIHASGMVRIDPIDNQGIYNNELKKYTHQLRIIKRYV